MSLEATMILMDNSEYARNGDLYPSRWVAQMEAIQLVANAKLENMESGLGLILQGGKQVQLLMTPTNDQNQLIATVEDQRLKGQIKFSVALYIAQLTLKHRVNKKQAQRIMAFVASPVEEDESTLISIAKKLKKNNIAVDVINFGEQREDHLQKLENFVNTVKKGNNSLFLNIKPGSSVMDLLFTALSNSVQQFQTESVGQHGLQQQEAVPQQPQQQGGIFAEWGGIDPNIDPELALAIKMSLEEEQNRQQTQRQQPQQQQPQQPQQASQSQNAMAEEPSNASEKPQFQKQIDQMEDEEQEELLKKAKELSLQEEAKDQEKKQAQQEQQHTVMDQELMEELLRSTDVNLEDEDIQKLLKKGDRSDDQKK